MHVVMIGCGFHGRGIAYELAEASEVTEVTLIDRDADLARDVAQKIGAKWHAVEVQDATALRAAIRGADMIFNGIGPYHYRRNGLCVVEAAIAEKVAYVDMNDDHEPAEALFLDPRWNQGAIDAGIPVITGTGIAPGVSGMLAKLGYQNLESPSLVDIWFSWNYSLQYPGALHHFFRINSGLAPQFIDSEYVRPGAFAGREEVEFLAPVGNKEVWYTGIIDPVSISCSLPGLRRVTAKGAYHQPRANQLLEAMIGFGFTSYEKIPGSDETPFEFLMKFLASEPGRAYFDIPIEDAPMGVRVRVTDEQAGETRVYQAQDFSRRATTSAAARVALMLIRGEIEFTGVKAPEGCVDPVRFLSDLATHPDIKFFEHNGGDVAQPLEFS